ncbi:MAG: long-chain fatty acid--CoA ligase [Shinella sp.]|nr:MAG: long-chain fatty acid--CoA ligase [Shinella sp.]
MTRQYLNSYFAQKAAFEVSPLPENMGEFVRERAQTMQGALVGNWFEEGETLSYRAFDEQADLLAASLLKRGVRKGTHVAVMLPNVAAYPVAWIAIGRIGAIMVPVNTAYTSDEMHFVLSDSDSQFLIIDRSLLSIYEGIDKPLPLLSRERVFVRDAAQTGYADLAGLIAEGTLPFVAPSPVVRDDLLCIQYTSGTTGFPKGCMLTHDYWLIISHYAAEFRHVEGRPIERTLIWAPFFYMDGMWQFLMAVRLGATVHMPKRLSLTKFVGWLKEYKINFCNFPEVAYRNLPPDISPEDLSLVYIGAYSWQPQNRREVQERFNLVAREAFGMTENGSCTIIPTEAVEKSWITTVGIEAPFRRLRIVDDEGNDVPDGEVGELWVAGRGILWGYYKRPEANGESFRGEWFRTGDLFRRDADGFYHIVGRIKDMIKRSGENIAAQEVEAVLRQADGVSEAAVIAVPDELRKEEVKAYLLLREGATPETVTPESVLEHCRKSLAAFKIPRYITYVDEFPRTPSRKIRKSELLKAPGDLRSGAWDRESGTWR